MWCKEIEISPSQVEHLCKDQKVNRYSGVLNMINFLKNKAEGKTLPSKDTIEFCVSLLDKVIPNLGEQQFKKIAFLNEQLKLTITNKYARRYSSDLLACTALWKNTSPALYKQLYEEGC